MTTSTTTVKQAADVNVEAYVRRCASYLDDLPLDMRSSLEHDVREIVSEVSAELEGEPVDLVGPPQRFVAELRRAAGLPGRVGPDTAPRQPPAPSPTPRRHQFLAVLTGLAVGFVSLLALLFLGFGMLAVAGGSDDNLSGSTVAPIAPLDPADTGQVFIAVTDLGSKDVLFSSSVTEVDQLVRMLEISRFESAAGFQVSFGSPGTSFNGSISDWDELIELVAHANDG